MDGGRKEENETFSLFTLNSQLPIVVTMLLVGSPIELELDSGAAVTVMSEVKRRVLSVSF